MNGSPAAANRFERRLGGLLIGVTYLAVALLGIGVAMLLVAGISPLAGGPPFDPAQLVSSILALEPAGFLWLIRSTTMDTPMSRTNPPRW